MRTKSMSKALALFWMIPFSVGSISVNYLIVTAYVLPNLGAYRRKLSPWLFCLSAYYVLVYLYGFALDSDWTYFDIIRSASFFTYAILFSLVFLQIKLSSDDLVDIFLLSAFGYSVFALLAFFLEPRLSLSDMYGVKSGLRELVPAWPQRYAPVLIFSLPILFHRALQRRLYFVPLVVVGCCALLTYTRALYLSVFVAFLFLFFSTFTTAAKSHSASKLDNLRTRRSLIITAISLSVIIGFMPASQQLVVIAERFTLAVREFFAGDVSEASVSDRLDIWRLSISLLRTEASLLFGSGFAGVHLYSNEVGSLHSQYVDVFFRTGIIGLVAYITMWCFTLWRYLFLRPEIASGLIAIFIFGFFHETTRLPYVGVLFFLLFSKAFDTQSIVCTSARRRKKLDR